MNYARALRWIWSATLASALLLSACSQSSTVSLPAAVLVFGHVNEVLPGVMIHDTIRDSEHAKVWIDGSRDTAFTNESGDWELTNVPVGTFTLSIQKDGYSYWKQFDVAAVGGPRSIQRVTLQWRDTQLVHVDSVTEDSLWGTKFWLRVGDTNVSNYHQRYVVLALARAKSTLVKEFDSADAFYFNGWLDQYPNLKLFPFDVKLANYAYGRDAVSVGDTLFGQFAECADNQAVYDPRKNHTEYPTHGQPSDIVQFVVR